MKFIDLADRLHILVLIIPPHSTHRLQPLDVGCFSPLASAYTNELNSLMHKSLGMVSLSKRMFWSLFHSAWVASFTVDNITSAFAATGIFPYNPSIVLAKIQKPLPESPPPKHNTARTPARTPISCHSVRKVQKAYLANPTEEGLDLILRANTRLAAQHSIDVHEKQGLIEALQIEKKKRKRGKRLNLLGEENTGPQFFSPSRVQQAKVFQAQKEADEQQCKEDIIERKAKALAI